MIQNIETYLIARYPAKKTLKEGEFQYITKSEISKLPLIQFKTCYNHLEFYKTQLQTAYFEFKEVDILIAVETGNPKNIYLLKSLSFEPPDQEFLKLFYNCAAKPANESDQLAHAITSLLASVAVQPQIEKVSTENNN